MIQIAVLGYGTVGSGVVEVINKNQNEVSKKAGVGIAVKYILDLRDFPGDPMEKHVVHDFDVILNSLPETLSFAEVCLSINKSATLSKAEIISFADVWRSIVYLELKIPLRFG